MKGWLKVTLFLCVFGTLREIRPSEPFVSEFLLGEWRNITSEQLNRQVYPLGTYCYLSLLPVVFLVTDFLRFKPVIILSGLSGIAVYAILLWTTSLEWVQASQFFYGLYMATEVAYYTYIYAKVGPEQYAAVSSYTRVATLAGRCASGALAQALVSSAAADYRQLNYVTFATQIAATAWALLLPPVPHGVYFHRRGSRASHHSAQLKPAPEREKVSCGRALAAGGALVARDARAAYRRGGVRAWSLLYAAAAALFLQAQTYVQLLWWHHAPAGDYVSYNGFVEAAQTLCGAGAAWGAAHWARAWSPAAAAALWAAAAAAAAALRDLHAAYAAYVVMGVAYNYIITLASAQIASQLSDESCFGLIFGVNTLLGSLLQSLLTLVMIGRLRLRITTQYWALSGLSAAVAAAWLAGCAVRAWRRRSRPPPLP